MQPANAALLICALVLTTALPLAAQASDPVAPVMVEIDPDPPGSDANSEWVEFHNPAPVPVSLEGLYLTESDGGILALEGEIAPGEHHVEVLPWGFFLNNDGDVVELVTENGTVLQSVAYGDDGDLPMPDDGQSLAACHLAAGLHGPWATAQETQGSFNPAC